MALVFRWYLGMSSRWAIEGSVERRSDYQIWCGPAQGLSTDGCREVSLLIRRNDQSFRSLETYSKVPRSSPVRNNCVPMASHYRRRHSNSCRVG